MKRKNILKEAGVLLIIAALIFSSVAMANIQTKQTQITLKTTHKGYGEGARGAIVWDNGMDYTLLATAQWDEPGAFDGHPADDFEFTEPTEVGNVHWIGGYWDGDPAEFDWCISFFLDDGTGSSPVGTPYNPSFAGPFCYTWEEIEKEEIEPGNYTMSVDLPENIPFPPGIYWIAIWGVGAFPPQSGWGYHDTIILHQAVFGSVYLGFPFWTDSELIFGGPIDLAFQLTTKLVANASGPYYAEVEEDIHFQGSASGGTPPYSYYWDFGNGYSSVLKDPIYAYDAEGVYNVTLTVTDSALDQAINTTTATIYPSCCFDVDIPKVFHIFYLTAEVTEICGMSHTDVPYTIKITGGVFFPPSPATFTGTIESIPANGVVPIGTDFMLGFGFIDIEITIGNCPPEYFDDGKIILIFILT